MCMTDKATGKTAWDKERTHELFRRYKEMCIRDRCIGSVVMMLGYMYATFFFMGFITTFAAVSYTHLDVYKRQPCRCAPGRARGRRCG